MDIQIHRTNNTTYVVIDSFFTQLELHEIKQELRDIKRFAGEPETTGAAFGKDKQYRKTGSGLFLEGLYSADRTKSSVLTHFNKIFNKDFVTVLANYDASFDHLAHSSRDATLVNYYENDEYYQPHRDTSVLTAVCFFTFGEVAGGEFVFPAYGVELACVENRLVLFHGCIAHGANAVKAGADGCRVSVAKFINYK